MRGLLRVPQIDPARYRPERDYGGLGSIVHLDGVKWFRAPVPPRWHRCWPQTRLNDAARGETVERCACGAIRLDRRHPWIERNSREELTAEDVEREERNDRADALISEYARAAPARQQEIRAELAVLLEQGP